MEKYRYTLCEKHLRLNLDEVPSHDGKNIQTTVRCSMVSGVMRESAKDGLQGKVARRKLPGAGLYPDAFNNKKNQRTPLGRGGGGSFTQNPQS